MPIPEKDTLIGASVTEKGFKIAMGVMVDSLKQRENQSAIYDTESELKSSKLEQLKLRAKALDTGKVFEWNRTSASGAIPITGAWTDLGLGELDQAKVYTDEKLSSAAENFTELVSEAETNAIASAAEDASNKALAAETNAISHTDGRVGSIPTNNIIPLVIDEKGNIPVWLENGDLDFAGSKTIGKSSFSSIIPLAVDSAGNIPVWLEDGSLGFSSLSLNTLNFLSNYFQSRKYQTNVFMGQRPIYTDSTSLRQWKAKAAKIKSGITDQLRVVLAGDSWAEHSTIATELKTILQTAYGEAGSGWINLGTERNMLDGITITYGSGWTVNDLDNTAAAFQYGSGPDGFTRTSTTAGSTITLANLTKGDQLTVFFGNTSGVFSYTINGVETNVTANSVKKVQITLNSATSVILKVISGTVCFFGMHMRKTTGSGVELNKVGNGNSTGQDYLKISPAGQAEVSSFLNPDVLIIILGTNDYRRGHSVANYQAGIMAMIDGFKSSAPNCAVILIAPAQSSVASPPIPLVNFVEAAFELIYYRQTEVYNMFDDWGAYDLENTNGQWTDSLHVSKPGAYRLSRQIFKRFLEI